LKKIKTKFEKRINSINLEASCWSSGSESWVVCAHFDTVGQWEFKLVIVKLHDVWSSALVGGDFFNSHDLD